MLWEHRGGLLNLNLRGQAGRLVRYYTEQTPKATETSKRRHGQHRGRTFGRKGRKGLEKDGEDKG